MPPLRTAATRDSQTTGVRDRGRELGARDVSHRRLHDRIVDAQQRRNTIEDRKRTHDTATATMEQRQHTPECKERGLLMAIRP